MLKAMRSFSAFDFLTLWERGAALHAIDRALLVLSCAMPEADYQDLVRFPLGQRDRCLLQVRQDNFGDPLDSYAECPACRERLDFSLSCAALLAETRGTDVGVKSVDIDGVHFDLRCPHSADAAAVAASASLEAGIEILLARCVRYDAGEGELTPAQCEAIAAELAALDPAAEILLDLSCTACGHGWQAVFDIAHFLWTEVRARARRLLQEVDTLGRTYHWSEADILSLSEARRALYLEMALS
jgi:hypothetical protein